MIVIVGVVAFLFGVTTGVLIAGIFAASSRADDQALLREFALWAERGDTDNTDINW